MANDSGEQDEKKDIFHLSHAVVYADIEKDWWMPVGQSLVKSRIEQIIKESVYNG